MTIAPIADVEPSRQGQVEAWLDSHHVVWEYQEELPLVRVDQAASLANQARLEPLDDDVVERYAADMARGDHFPPVLAWRKVGSRARLRLLGGNHRHAAALRSKRQCLAAYVVECEPETALILTYEDNRRHGLPPSTSERVLQAVHLIDNGMAQEVAAKAVGIPAGSISYERSIVSVGRRAADLEVRGFDHLPKTARYRLSMLRSDPVFVQAGRLCVDAGMTAGEIGRLVDDLVAARSDVDALQRVGAELEERRAQIQRGAGGRMRTERTARSKLLSHATGIRMLAPSEITAACPTSTARLELVSEITTLGEHLARLVKALKAPR